MTQSIKAQTQCSLLIMGSRAAALVDCSRSSLPSIQVQLLAQRACAVAVLINCPAQSCILCTCEHTIAKLPPLQVEENDICPIRTVNRITGRNPRELWMVHSKHSVKCPYLISLAVIFFSSGAPPSGTNIRRKLIFSAFVALFSQYAAAAAAKSFQSCSTQCDPIDGSQPGSFLPGILQARILEWVAISFSTHVPKLVCKFLGDSKTDRL